MTVDVHRLPVPTETPYRLGRHVKHDDRSLDFAFPFLFPLVDKTTVWTYSEPVLNQMNTSSCTGNAMAGFFNTDYAAPTRRAKGVPWMTETMALQFYGAATHEESDQTQWYPPNDNGSNGLDVAKAAVQMGWADRYQHAFEFSGFRAALQNQPVLVGTVWTNDMFSVDNNYQMHIGSLADDNVAGGHEYLALEIHYDTRLLWFLTSWGAAFAKNGKFALSFDDFEALLSSQGDVIAPHGVGLP
jgi:hypothetical protein